MRFTRWLLEQQMSYQEALEVLGISADNASDKDFLKKQWKKLALQHHPDRGGSEKMMQRINAAYDILAKGEKGGSKTGSGSKSGGARKGGRSREERQREEEKWKEKRKEIKKVLEKRFNPSKFVEYLEGLTGKEFTYSLEWRDPSNWLEHSAGASITFESVEKDISIPLNFSAFQFVDLNENFDIHVNTYIFYQNQKHKVRKSEHTTLKVDALSSPQRIWPKKKVQEIFSGQKGGKFKKKDMLTFLKSKLDADVKEQGSNVITWIPVGGGYELILERLVAMKLPSWTIQGLYFRGKRKERPKTFAMPESEETAEFLKTMQEEMSKIDSEDGKADVMLRLASQMRKRLKQ